MAADKKQKAAPKPEAEDLHTEYGNEIQVTHEKDNRLVIVEIGEYWAELTPEVAVKLATELNIAANRARGNDLTHLAGKLNQAA